RAGVPDRAGRGQHDRDLGGAASRLAMDVLSRRAAGGPGAVSSRAVAGIAALARRAWPRHGRRGRYVDDRAGDAEVDRPSAAAGAAGDLDGEPTGVVVRPVRADLSAAHARRLGDL